MMSALARYFSPGAILLLIFALIPTSVWAGAGGFTAVQSTQVIKKNEMKVTAGARYESGRVLYSGSGFEAEYDNLRIHPVSFEYGLGDVLIPGKPLEVGGSVSYSSNSCQTTTACLGGVDGSGLEGITGFAQLKVHEFVSPQVGFKFLGSDEIAPYTNDGIDFWFNVPGSVSVSQNGEVYGEFGYTLKSGEAAGGADVASYPNYGVGYRHNMSSVLSVSGELAGHGATFDISNADNKSSLELRGGATMEISDGQKIHPNLSLGLSDGSPSFALGARYSRMF